MSPELKQFYKDMQAWIDEGCYCPDQYDTNFPNTIRGLCDNLDYWTKQHNIAVKDFTKLRYELQTQFEAAGLHKLYPFNCDGKHPGTEHLPFYADEIGKKHCYTNPLRLAWVKRGAEA